jgi:hypothetical protein
VRELVEEVLEGVSALSAAASASSERRGGLTNVQNRFLSSDGALKASAS